MIEKQIRKCITEIENCLKTSDYIISVIGKAEEELIETIYDSSLLRMCIKYEAFTSDAYKILRPQEKISYNKPWSYTREISKILKTDVKKEYEKAHEGWEIYNSLKHINNNTQRNSKRIEEKLKLRTPRDRAKYLKESLISLLKKLYI